MTLKDLRQRGAILRFTLFILSVLALIFLSLAGWYTGDHTNYTFYYDGWGSAIVWSTVAAPSWTFLYCLSILIVIAAQGTYHPGIDVGMDLMGWLVNISFAATTFWFFGDAENDDMYSCGNEYGQFDQSSCNQAREFVGFGFTGGILTLFCAILHFAFFVVACKATNARRSKKMLDYELGDIGPKRKAGPAPAY